MITKREIAAVLTREAGLSQPQADRTLGMIFDEIMDRVKGELKTRGISQIEGLGTVTKQANVSSPLLTRGMQRRAVKVNYNMVFDEIMD